MANTLTDLAADIYKAADVVGRELVGFATSVVINGDGSQRVALNDTVRSHFTQQPGETVSISPSMTIPEGDDQTVDNKTLTIDKAKAIQIPWRGEEQRSVNNGAGFETIYGDQVTQAMRTLVNEIETDLAIEAYINASRAVGEAGTTPFGSNFDVIAEVRQVLVDNGCPADMLSLVMNTAAGTKLRNLAQLQRVNESGGNQLLRQGVLLDLQGIAMKESAQVQKHSAGSATDVETDGAHEKGDTTITLANGGSWSGSIEDGDAVTIDNHTYIVKEGTSDVTSTSEITIHEPGLREDVASGTAVSVESDFTANVALRQSASELAMRAPAVPEGGDAARDAMTIQDPWSGLVFEIRDYRGYRKSMFEVAATWGVKAWKPEHIAILMG